MASLENPQPRRDALEQTKPRDEGYDIRESKERKDQPDEIERHIEERTGAIATKNKTEIYDSGQDFFKTLENEIGSAKDSIHINLFSFSNDATGTRIANALIAAKAKNPNLRIDIRVDRIGSFVVGSKDSLATLAAGGGSLLLQRGLFSAENVAQISAILKDPSSIHDLPQKDKEKWQSLMQEAVTDELLLSQNAPLRKLRKAGIAVHIEQNDLSSMDHSKVFIFDDKTLYTGGMNIGDDYSGGYDAKKGWNGTDKTSWKDYMVKMQGGAADIQRKLFFNEDAKGAPAAAPEGGVSVRVLHNKGGASSEESFGRDKQISFATYHLLDKATTDIVVEHAYIMDDEIVNRLVAAGERGVSVRIVRSKPESASLEAANAKFFAKLEGKKNIMIQPSDRVLHTKLLCVDGKYAIIGSANLTKESLQFHEETSVFIANNGVQKDLAIRADKAFEKSLEGLLGKK